MHPIFDLVVEGIAKSKELILLAELSEWEKFSTLQADCQHVVHAINLENIVLSDSAHTLLSKQMKELIDLNQQLELICGQERSNASQELKKIRQGSDVSRAYSQ